MFRAAAVMREGKTGQVNVTTSSKNRAPGYSPFLTLCCFNKADNVIRGKQYGYLEMLLVSLGVGEI